MPGKLLIGIDLAKKRMEKKKGDDPKKKALAIIIGKKPNGESKRS